MDIENMHPFCLPFGFCHDATSSSMTPEFSLMHNNNNSNNNSLSTSSNENNNNSNNKNNNNKLRSITSSPTDELFRHLNSTSSLVSSHSLLHDDLISIESPLAFDLNGDVESFYSIKLDIDIDTRSSPIDETGHGNSSNSTKSNLLDSDEFLSASRDGEGLSLKSSSDQDDNWYCNQFSLFSPPQTTQHNNNNNNNHHHHHQSNSKRNSLIKAALSTAGINHHQHHPQVFQHVVDSIDIKSSPTLAQLNLNSNDDMTDSLWDPISTSSASHANDHHLHHHHHHSDLHSNSTSIRVVHLPGSLSSSTSGAYHHLNSTAASTVTDSSSTLICNHLHNRHRNEHTHSYPNHHTLHQHQHHHPNATSQQSTQQQHQVVQSSSQPAHHGANSRPVGTIINSDTDTCAAANSPHEKSSSFNQQQQQSPSTYQPAECCHNLLTTTNNHEHNNLKTVQANNQASTADLQSNRQQLAPIDKQNNNNSQQQRSASPALVTSSSSPLSSSLSSSLSLSLNQADGRPVENKLKENIDYLTALLCNGNKQLDSKNQQSPTISSTMVRSSYSTLAQTLATGPKLLERSQQIPFVTGNNTGNSNSFQLHPSHNLSSHLTHQPNQNTHQLVQQPSSVCNNFSNNSLATNEASANQQEVQNQVTQASLTSTQLKRPYPDQWFKMAGVESSVSAADSTESQLSSGTTSSNSSSSVVSSLSATSNDSTIPTKGILDNRLYNLNQNQLQTQRTNNAHKPASELKVLSSLLNNSNQKCASQSLTIQHPSLAQSNYHQSSNWQDQQMLQYNTQPIHSTLVETVMGGVSHMVTNGDQQQPVVRQDHALSVPSNGKPITLMPHNNTLVQQKAKLTLFAQPASPSTSSTASSGANESSGVGLLQTTTSQQQIHSAGSAPKRQRSSAHSAASKQQAGTGTSNRSNRPNSMSTDCSLSSHDEGFSSQIDNDDCGSARDSDDEDDVDSDDESFYGDYTNSDLIGASISDNAENKWTLNMGRSRRNGQKRYFWQYNVQSKGPKGTRICSTDDSEDPFVLPEASDPVFSNDCQVEGVKHSGKARRGDGNDLTPNPRKLLMIGLELKKLSKIINDLAPVIDLPVNSRNKTRKEKNKLASRACRLKKKAQHEANKIKLYGLQREHQQVVLAIYDVRKLLNETLQIRDNKSKMLNSNQQQGEIQPARLDEAGNVSLSIKAITENCTMNVAGQTSDYVNSVLEKVVSGCIDGGLTHV